MIRAAFRNDEITGYWDNGDFIIGMPNLDKTQGNGHLTELLSILRKQVFTSPGGERFQVTFDYATAEFIQDGKTLHSLYQVCTQSQY